MNLFIRLCAPLLPALLSAQPATSDPGGVLSAHTVARFETSGVESIQSMRTDSAGNLYLAGTTSSPDLALKNATQPSAGEALLMESLDRGVTWRKVPNPPATVFVLTPHPRDTQTLLAGTAKGIYKTSDGGWTWRLVYSWPLIRVAEPTSSGSAEVVFDPVNPRHVYGYMFSFRVGIHPSPITTHGLLVSADAGESWQVRNVDDAYSVFRKKGSLWVDPNGSGTVVLTGESIWLSRDHGTTWVRTPFPGFAAYSVPDPRRAGWIYAVSGGRSGGLYVSQDWGATWTWRPGPSGSWEFDPDIAGTLYAFEHLRDFYVSRDDGGSWSKIPRGPSFPDFSYRPILLPRRCGGGAMVTVDLGRVVSSFDFGVT